MQEIPGGAFETAAGSVRVRTGHKRVTASEQL